MNYVNTFREKMKKQAESISAELLSAEIRKKSELEIFKESSTPVVERLKRLIASIPIEEVNNPRPLEWYRTRLRGIEGRGAHAGQVGNALRALGYERKRAWSGSLSGFRSLWYTTKNN